jgi:hypothetical protein
MNEPKLAQMNKVLYKRFRVTNSEGKTIIEPVIIKKVQSFCNEMKVTDRCTFLEGWLQNLNTSTCRTHTNGKLLYLVVQSSKGAV